MAYDFKNLNEVDRQDKPTENTTVMAFESGQPKQIPASEFGGCAVFVKIEVGDIRTDTDGSVVFDFDPYVKNEIFFVDTINYDYIYEALLKGQLVYMQVSRDAQVKADWLAYPNDVVIRFGMDVQGLFVGTRGVSMCFTNGSYHTTA